MSVPTPPQPPITPGPQDPGFQHSPIGGQPPSPPFAGPAGPHYPAQPAPGIPPPGVQPPTQQSGGVAAFGDIGQRYTDLARTSTAGGVRAVPYLAGTAVVALVVVIAAFLPWVSFAGGSVSGTEGGDGAFTLIVGLIAGVLAVAAVALAARHELLPRIAAIVSVAVGAIVTAIAIVDIGNVGDSQVTGLGLAFDFSVGFGLWLTLIGGLAFVALGIVTIIVHKRG